MDKSGAPLRTRLREKWLLFRNRLLASSDFQRRASSFLLTRGVARKQARTLFDLSAGFVYSQTLAFCVQTDLLARLEDEPKTTAELSALLSIPETPLRTVIRAACALKLIEPCGEDRFTLGQQGAALLGNPGVLAMIKHHALLYADLADPEQLVKAFGSKTNLANYWSYAARGNRQSATCDSSSQYARYSALMSATQPFVSREIFSAYSFEHHKVLLDLGGGDGAFTVAALQHAPRLKAKVVDLPPVAALARERIRQQNADGSAEAVDGDIFADPLPSGADLITLVRVLHDHNDEAVSGLLQKAHAALEPGGVLLIAEPMAGFPRGTPQVDTYFGIYLLAMGQGRPRSVDEITALLKEAGFAEVRALPTNIPLLTQVVIGRRKPSSSV